MRWPWEPRATPERNVGQERVSATTVSPAGWASLPPLSPQLTPTAPTADLTTFPGRGSAWSSPALTTTLQRQVAPSMPVLGHSRPSDPGRVSVATTPAMPVASRPPSPTVQRTTRAAGVPPTAGSASDSGVTTPSPAVEHAFTRSTSDHLPVLVLPAEPLTHPPVDDIVGIRSDEVVLQPAVGTEVTPVRVPPSRPLSPSAAPGDTPPAPLPLAVQRSATAEPSGITEVDIPSAPRLPSVASDPEPLREVRPHPMPEPVASPSSPDDTAPAAGKLVRPAAPRLGLGAPLPSTPTGVEPSPRLPVAQRATGTPTTPPPTVGPSPAGPSGLHGPPAVTALELRTPPTTPEPALTVVHRVADADSAGAEPVDESDSEAVAPMPEGMPTVATVAPESGSTTHGPDAATPDAPSVPLEPPAPPAALPLTLLRSVDEPGAEEPGVAAVPVPALLPDRATAAPAAPAAPDAPDAPDAIVSTSRGTSTGVVALGGAGYAAAPTASGIPPAGDGSTPTAVPSLPLAGPGPARSPAVVAARSAVSSPVAQPAASTVPTVQRAALGTAVRPEPAPHRPAARRALEPARHGA